MPDDEISRYLESLEREDAYRVDCVLKRSDIETTERVFAQSADGSEHGPYIRKYIARDSGMGDVYGRIYEACQAGRHFAHLPHVLDFYRTEQATVVVMEHVNGQTLADVVYERDPGVALAAGLFPALCDAVSELHESFDPPIIHRDLKPGNVMVRNGVPVLIDFGIAREYHDAAETDTVNLGTRAYAPPEQFGYEQTTVRSDVYTLGLLLYYLLVEQTPSPKVMRRGFADARIPEELRRVIAYATAFDPKERYESAAELKLAFLDALARCAPVTATMSPQAVQAAQGASAPVAQGVSAPVAQAAPARHYSGTAAPPAGSEQNAPSIQWSADFAAQNAGEPAKVNVEIHVARPDGEVSPTPSAPNAVVGYGKTAPRTEQRDPAKKGLVRNILVLGVFALFVAASWMDAFDPSRVQHAYPAPYHQFMYLLVVPVFFGFFAYAALDKDGLDVRYPKVPWIRGKTTVLVCLGIFLALLVLAYIFGKISGVY